jgi:hypothetical protein
VAGGQRHHVDRCDNKRNDWTWVDDCPCYCRSRPCGSRARSDRVAEKKPRVIICDTKMAKGVPFLETREKSHFLRVERDEWQPAIEALGAGRIA